MNPIIIGILGTVIAVIMLIAAMRQGKGRESRSGVLTSQTVIAVLFIGVIWFIILRLLPAA